VNLPSANSLKVKLVGDRPKTAESVAHDTSSFHVREAWSSPQPSLSHHLRGSKQSSSSTNLTNGKLKSKQSSQRVNMNRPPSLRDPTSYTKTRQTKLSTPKSDKSITNDKQYEIGENTMDKAIEDDETAWSAQGGRALMGELPVATSIPVCLNHIIDTFIRRVLPWQVSTLHSNGK
jgi:hypothetical protein